MRRLLRKNPIKKIHMGIQPRFPHGVFGWIPKKKRHVRIHVGI